MLVTDEEENVKFGVQSKALSKRHAVPLGASLENLRSEWWIITVHANSDNPVCYIMRLEEVRKLATRDNKHGNHWLVAKSYDQPEFREAWHRIADVSATGNAEALKAGKHTKIERERQNGVTRPLGAKTARVWAIADELSTELGEPAQRGALLDRCREEGLNPNMSATNYSLWRKFHGLTGRAAPGKNIVNEA